ncbi:MAG TPA: serine/threonine-protein kinase [Candidatus Sulfotelmatobacter sp.]|nr:serine/threonine-protein kinase [Candidatus Sulfotelmatobacter sp.]
MSTKIGQFEIVSELAKSATSTIYKANDESGQTVALKAIQLSAFGESSAALQEALLKEVESVKVLSSSNITKVTDGSEIDGQFCAPMEYVQGNSIATMLARKEGFSIWDLLDIGRQLCAGFDHAKSHGLVHYSLEPAKIMCGWDGTVKILSFGVSSVGNFVQHASGGVSPILHYMSPEQIRGEAIDARSNLFSLGAMFYEMVTERKAFDRQDVQSLRDCILESAPAAPIQLNAKIHPLLSDLIMKALSKDPAQRYQTGRQLLDDLENCKESRPAKKPEAPKGTVATSPMKAAVQPKFVGSAPAAASPVAPPAVKRPAAAPPPKPMVSAPAQVPLAAKPSRLAVPKTAAAAAGIGGSVGPSTSSREPAQNGVMDSGDATLEAADQAPAYMSSAVADEPPVETFPPQGAPDAPRIAVDPLMAEGGQTANTSTSFSEISELPPLKEVYIEPPPPPSAEVPLATPVSPAAPAFRAARKPEKPKVQPREVAQKAIKEIKGVPPKLIGYSLAAAGALILAIAIGVTIYIHNQSDDDTGRSSVPAASQAAPAQPAPAQAAPPPEASAPAETQPAQPQSAETQSAETPESTAPVAEPIARSRGRGARKKAAAPVAIPGELTVDSTPQGALVRLDGQGDATWVTPLALSNLQPGPHSISVSKTGYGTDTRTVNIASGSKGTTTIHLTQSSATLVVKSNPAGANIFVDGRDVGTKTPAQVSVNKGEHVVLVRMTGYLDETMNAQFVLGQTYNFSPSLRPMGNADSIRTVGKMSKLFGGKAGKDQGTVSIHTTPKGAQVAVNQHMVEKNSPVDVALDPGNYVIDITLNGYAPVHKVVTATTGGKVVIDEVLQPQ